MKNYKFLVNGGGVFSRLLQCAIIPLADVDFDNVYLEAYPLPNVDGVEPHVKPGIRIVDATVDLLVEHGVTNPWDSMLNFILNQHDHGYQDQGLLPIGVFYNQYNRIESSPRFSDYREVYRRLNIKSEVISGASQLLQGGENVLGVHVRLKDANSVNDPAEFQNYVDAIEYNLRNHSYSKIFVSADNNISITKLKELYPGMVLSNDLMRSENEESDSFIWEYQNYFRKHYWVHAMIDCLTLSKCRTLICKNSNFSNSAIVFGNYENIHRISK